MADVLNRRYSLLFVTITWTTLSLLIVVCDAFWQILLLRIGFAAMMSGCVPLCVSLITEYFDHEELGRANSFFAFGVYLGVGLSSLSIILDKAMGWKWALGIICILSYLFSSLTFFVKEPRDQRKVVDDTS